jgi:hypothetical protein
MFLFTTPPAGKTQSPASPVLSAIRTGAERTGVDYDYLVATAQRESALGPSAKARTSSASGLFQFIEQTWLGLVKGEGAKHGLGDYAAAVASRSDGTLTVPDPAVRREILALREDPVVAAKMAGVLTQKNRDVLAGEIGREPTPADLYIAHFLGARGASELIRTAQRNPARPAAGDFPEAAAANRTIFYDRSGRARGAGEVYAVLAASHARVAPATVAGQDTAPPIEGGPSFHGLFQTAARRGAVSDAVARLWKSNQGAGARTAAIEPFFPRAAMPGAIAPATPPAATSSSTTATGAAQAGGGTPGAPAPPVRPFDLAPMGAGKRATGAPLDLSRFMVWGRKT